MVLIQWIFPLRTIWQNNSTLQDGQVFRFRTVPIDPNDPFRGKYMTLGYRDVEYNYNDDSGVNWVSRQTAYVVPVEDEEGYAMIDTLYAQAPTTTDTYFQATVRDVYIRDTTMIVDLYFPFDRFYMEEERAPRAEDFYRQELQKPATEAYAKVSIKKGRAVLQDVVVNGVLLNNIAKQ